MTFVVRAKIDVTRLVLWSEDLRDQRRFAYAVVNAINTTAIGVQGAEFQSVRRKFEVRRPTFFFGTPTRPGGVAARISPRASVGRGRAFAEISVRGPTSSSSRRTLLPTFEEGGEKRPQKAGATRLAIPITGGPARPSFPSMIRPEFTFARLGLHKVVAGRAVTRLGRGGKRRRVGLFDTSTGGRVRLPGAEGAQLRGRQRTFVIRPEASFSYPSGGVFRRKGPGERNIEMVYAFRRRVRVDRRLGFIPLGVAVANRLLGPALEFETTQALARAFRRARR